ncbi:hypothetical protein [Accumulibacter sp.]|uniref:hypothetical protein n=1 Tax=Accumulibacter sp. TaxID=2053492 RepID=UPI00263462A3|nr:hypothetical protein [Accumulibacter sp.]
MRLHLAPQPALTFGQSARLLATADVADETGVALPNATYLAVSAVDLAGRQEEIHLAKGGGFFRLDIDPWSRNFLGFEQSLRHPGDESLVDCVGLAINDDSCLGVNATRPTLTGCGICAKRLGRIATRYWAMSWQYLGTVIAATRKGLPLPAIPAIPATA